jgi:hypothetical protein
MSTTPSTINTAEAPASPSPLWIIALFIALSEVVAGVAAITTDGTTRLIFAIFAVTFPIVVLASFVWLLLKHPGNLYSPWQYTAQTSVESYVSALRRERRDFTTVIGAALTEAVTTAVEPRDAQDGGRDPKEVRARVEDAFADAVQRNSIAVDPSMFLPGADPVTFAVGPETTVQDLLDSVYFALQPAVEPYSYGRSWVLSDAELRPLPEIPSSRSKRVGRKLSEVGLEPGATLVATRVTQRNATAADGTSIA